MIGGQTVREVKYLYNERVVLAARRLGVLVHCIRRGVEFEIETES